MARDRKDRSASWYMERHGGALLRLAPISGVLSWKAAQTVLAFPKQIPDGLLDVMFEGNQTPDPFLIEIESYPEQDTLEQIRKDLAMVILTRGVIPDILVLVLHPKGKLRIEPEQIATSAHGLTDVRIRVHVVNLWDVPAERLLAAGDVGLIPWVPLARYDGSPRKLLEEYRDRIEEQATPEEKGNFLAVTRVMAEMRYNDVELLSLFGGQIMSFNKVLMDTPAFQRFVAHRERKAAKKAAKDAARATEWEATRKHIALCLAKRFGSVPKDSSGVLEAIEDQARLDELLETAMVCADLKTFRKSLGKA